MTDLEKQALERWSAETAGRMHVAKITNKALAAECGYSVAYVSEVLNLRRGTDHTRAVVDEALSRLEIARRPEITNATEES